MNSFGAGSVIVLAVVIGIYYQQYFRDETRIVRHAWLTLLTNDKYVPGLLALTRSLKRANTSYPLVAMITLDSASQESQQSILNEGCLLRPIEGLFPEYDKTNLAFELFIHSWTKLRAFQMIDICDKCVFMDADMIVLHNTDELLELEDNPNFAAAQRCICNPDNTPSRLPYVYNSLKTFSKTHPYLWDETRIKVIHYILAKPWNKADPGNADYDKINRLWQQAYTWRMETRA
ncbi:unnamed protein product [Didymodactylos carnosus]|uniref:glycogenin glucosyltransferase n=1 Tax=Didymodactylos carnosus TaxID=1234261 RepID=A0A815TAI9_9BILA|nr:unnamed protein product [Didymodactylos carnosus]CAF1501144.1 unnamed protein product [Didymodactylos carnosus]CAF4283252.1 unnamed protein product [Didymodactylos carnosus]CAF4362731.1 unnamed protein product [Didymodactylos carnosus]